MDVGTVIAYTTLPYGIHELSHKVVRVTEGTYKKQQINNELIWGKIGRNVLLD